MSCSPSSRTIVCKEIFDENSVPSEEGKAVISNDVLFILEITCVCAMVSFMNYIFTNNTGHGITSLYIVTYCIKFLR